MKPKALVETVSDAIAAARYQRPYGLYDYSKYPGDVPAHQVHHEHAKLGERSLIGAFNDEKSARILFEKLSAEYVAQAAIHAMTEWTAREVAQSWADCNGNKSPWHRITA